MKKLTFLFFVILTFLMQPIGCMATNTYAKQVLFADGKTDYSIYVSTDASDSEVWAADELQHWLKEISGVDFPIIKYSSAQELSTSEKKIFVGFSKTLKEKIGHQEPAYNDESFQYFSNGSDIYIYGGKQRGTMYGVFAFLENELGCRWYSPEVTKIPTRNKFSFSVFNHCNAPKIKVRNDFFFPAFDPVWMARNKMNGTMGSTIQNQMGGSESYWGVHTFFHFLPPAEFFGKHPEYFSLINGKRVGDSTNPDWGKRTQLCLSNPNVLKIMIKRVKEYMKEHPEHMIYSVSQNDWRNPCECSKCNAIKAKYGNRESGILIWFVNQVAEAVEKDFPDKYIGTLAYQYTRSAPENIKPRRNVVIRLCPIEACMSHTLLECLENQSFVKDLQDWSEISTQLYIWDYAVNFKNYLIPFPNFGVLQQNIKTFAEHKAIGVMEQGSYQERGSELQVLRMYLISKLLWDYACDTNKIIDDFMYGYYGRSGQYVREYYNMLQQLVTLDKHMTIYSDPDHPIYNDDFVKGALKVLRKAESVADNDEVLERVKMVTMSVLFLKCKRSPVEAREDGSFKELMETLEKEKIAIPSEASYNLEDFKKFVLSAK